MKNQEVFRIMSHMKGLGSLVLVIALVFFTVQVSSPMLSLLAVDMAQTFLPASFAPGTSEAAQKAAVGMVKQTSTINSAFEVVAAVALSFLAIRFRHKSLLLAGVGLVLVSAIGSYFAPTLLVMQAFFALEGFGTVMVLAMGYTIVGEHVPMGNKAKATSYIVATAYFAGIVGMIIINRITTFGGWQLNFLIFTLPLSALSLILALFVLPKTQKVEVKSVKSSEKENNIYWVTFRQILKNRSAVSYLIGYMIFGMVVTGGFALPFYMQEFRLSLDFVTMISLGVALTTVISTLIMGRILARKGAKILIIASAVLDGVFTMIFFSMPNYQLAITLDIIHIWTYATVFVGFAALALDQVPVSRGTFISMRSMFLYIGTAIGAAIGATLLSTTASYQVVGVALGVISIAMVPFILLIKDTTKTIAITEPTIAEY